MKFQSFLKLSGTHNRREGAEDKGGAGAKVDGNKGVVRYAAADFDDAIAKDLIDLELTDCAMIGCLDSHNELHICDGCTGGCKFISNGADVKQVVRDWSRIFGDTSQLILEADDLSLRFVGEGIATSSSMNGNKMVSEARRLLEKTLPELPKPELPELPNLKSIFELPEFLNMNYRSFPKLKCRILLKLKCQSFLHLNYLSCQFCLKWKCQSLNYRLFGCQ
ncbi:hypothetical protein RJ639_021964 [Escallonia herrerae]|uniref:Uncharacterized protein n=1 Tax=Escallonia herrerae TaxID=1293975 RepID=A0AA89AGE8_9ASTE|nr:hypothetical protein RJ639_021964 [Escallonia herrerae]